MTEPKPLADRRFSPRHSTSIPGRLRCSRGTRHQVEIVDLSVDGCSIALSEFAAAGAADVGVKIGSLESLGGALRWRDGKGAGVEFDRPLHPAVLDHMVGQYPRSPADRDDG